MAWCLVGDIEQRLTGVPGAYPTNQDEVEGYISRAQRLIESKLLPLYGKGRLDLWLTAVTVPPRIIDLTADMAALLILKDKIGDFKGRIGDRENTSKFLDELVNGEAELMGVDGNIIPRVTALTKFNKTSKTPIFSMGNEGDGTLGEGTLDDY
jgi:hypothetical protein